MTSPRLGLDCGGLINLRSRLPQLAASQTSGTWTISPISKTCSVTGAFGFLRHETIFNFSGAM